MKAIECVELPTVLSAVVENGYVVLDGFKLEKASNFARNQFGYILDQTWQEVFDLETPIWVSEYGDPWI